jgi:hypothetical protein
MPLTQRTIEYYDYHEMRDLIAEKHGIDERDYKNAHCFNYVDALVALGVDRETAEVLYRTAPAEMSAEHQAINAKVVEQSEEWRATHPYCDFWHFMLDYFNDDFSKGKPLHLNWSDVKDCADEEWQKEIAQLYIDEFGDQDYVVIVDW